MEQLASSAGYRDSLLASSGSARERTDGVGKLGDTSHTFEAAAVEQGLGMGSLLDANSAMQAEFEAARSEVMNLSKHFFAVCAHPPRPTSLPSPPAVARTGSASSDCANVLPLLAARPANSGGGERCAHARGRAARGRAARGRAARRCPHGCVGVVIVTAGYAPGTGASRPALGLRHDPCTGSTAQGEQIDGRNHKQLVPQNSRFMKERREIWAIARRRLMPCRASSCRASRRQRMSTGSLLNGAGQ